MKISQKYKGAWFCLRNQSMTNRVTSLGIVEMSSEEM